MFDEWINMVVSDLWWLEVMMMLRAVTPPPQCLFSAFGIMIMYTEDGERFRDYIWYSICLFWSCSSKNCLLEKFPVFKLVLVGKFQSVRQKAALLSVMAVCCHAPENSRKILTAERAPQTLLGSTPGATCTNCQEERRNPEWSLGLKSGSLPRHNAWQLIQVHGVKGDTLV